MPDRTRKPTGKPPWPLLLIAGREKAGKTYSSAAASASKHLGHTYWVSVGEDDPDELGALPGARFDIVIHDGTYRGVLDALTWAAAQPAKNGKPNLIVLDSATRMWALLSDMAQAEANRRRKNDDATITADLWNLAKQRWQHILNTLRQHAGPSILTARLDVVTVMDGDKPTKDKILKVQAEKNLLYEVGAIVQLHAVGDAHLTGVRSLRVKPMDQGESAPYPDFTVEKLWTDLGVVEKDATSGRVHAAATGEESVQAEEALTAYRGRLLTEIRELVQGSNDRVNEIARQWHSDHGHRINETEDVHGLAALRDSLRPTEEAAA